MKKIVFFSIFLIALATGSCTLDNYNAPNASLTGSIVDAETNELIQQDLIQGSVIEYIEQGYANPQTQQLRFHCDGTFANLTMFAGKYKIQAVRGNFATTPLDSIDIIGNTVYTFSTLPYIRIKEPKVSISSDSSLITATFKLDNVVQKPIKQVALFIDQSPSVGQLVNEVSMLMNVNSVGTSTRVYTIMLPTTVLKKGKTYFFRIGALANVPEAKFNFALAIQMKY